MRGSRTCAEMRFYSRPSPPVSRDLSNAKPPTCPQVSPAKVFIAYDVSLILSAARRQASGDRHERGGVRFAQGWIGEKHAGGASRRARPQAVAQLLAGRCRSARLADPVAQAAQRREFAARGGDAWRC